MPWAMVSIAQGFDMASYENMVYVGGQFYVVDVVVANSVARWNGNRWSGLGSGVTKADAQGIVYAIAIADDGVFIGGDFTIAGFKPSYYFGYWNGPLVTAVPESGGTTPASLSTMLRSARPNPTSQVTTIPFHLDEAGPVRVDVYDLHGQRLATLIDANLGAGDHVARWDARNVPAGTYIHRIVHGTRVETGVVEVVR